MEYSIELKKHKLNELVDISSSKRVFAKEYTLTGVPFYRSKEIIEKSNNREISQKLYISKEKYQDIKDKHGAPQEGDLLLTSVGTLGIPYLVSSNEEFYFKDGNLTWFRNFNGINNRFLYYWFLSDYAKEQINGRYIGSTQKALTISALNDFEIHIPSIDNQNKIVKILSSLDKKIETNNKIIANLEAQAQALFKYYFIDFEPFTDGNFVDSDLGPIPEGWEVSNLEKIANYKNGVAIKKFPPKDKDNSLPALKIRELNKNSTDESSDVVGNYIDESVKVYDGDVIFSWSGTLLVKIWTGGDAGLNQHLFKVTSEKYDKWFYYLWTLYHLEKFISIARDKATTMGHIKRSHLKESNVLICDEKTYKNANDVLNPIIELIINLGIQNRALAQARDALLPKLMAGEIDLEDIGGTYD